MNKTIFYNFVPMLVLPLLLLACGAAEDVAEQQVYKPQVQVTEIDYGLNQTFQLTGEVTAERRVDFTSEYKANVEQIYVKPGDSVSKGQLLVTLNAPNVAQRYNTAANTYSTANLNLQQTKLGAQKAVDAANAALVTAETNLVNLRQQDANRRAQAQEALNAAKLNQELNNDSAETQLNNALLSVPTTVDTALQYVVEVNKVSRRVDAQAFNNRELYINNLRSVLNGYSQDYASATSILNQTSDLLQSMLSYLNNNDDINGVVTADQRAGYISGVSGYFNQITTLTASLNSANQAVISAAQNAGGTSQAIVNAQAAYNATIADLDASLQAAQRRVEESKIALQSAQTTAGISELGARTSLTSVSGELSQASIERNKLVLRAPFAGVVSDVLVKIGSSINPGDRIAAVENGDTLKITTYLSASQVRKVAVGDVVNIGKQSEDVISAVAPSADPTTKKYKVEILHQNPYLKSGEFIPLVFTGNATANTVDATSIFVPITAVQLLTNETFVWTLDGDRVKKTVVSLGAIEGDVVEVIAGLNVGDLVVTEGGRIIEEEGTEVLRSDA